VALTFFSVGASGQGEGDLVEHFEGKTQLDIFRDLERSDAGLGKDGDILGMQFDITGDGLADTFLAYVPAGGSSFTWHIYSPVGSAEGPLHYLGEFSLSLGGFRFDDETQRLLIEDYYPADTDGDGQVDMTEKLPRWWACTFSLEEILCVEVTEEEARMEEAREWKQNEANIWQGWWSDVYAAARDSASTVLVRSTSSDSVVSKSVDLFRRPVADPEE
jgi:hypothetical protein